LCRYFSRAIISGEAVDGFRAPFFLGRAENIF
jgi:hypothetical protein